MNPGKCCTLSIENTGEMNKECEEKIRSSVEDCKKRFVK